MDSSLNRLLLYSATGRGKPLPQPEDQLPALLATSGDRVLLKLVGQDVVSLDAGTLGDSKTHSVARKARTPIGPLSAIYQWAGVDHALLAVGLVRGKTLPEGFQAGLFRLSSEEGATGADLLLRIDAWDYYVLGYQYVTSTSAGGGAGYFLDLDHGAARLFEIPLSGAAHELTGAVPPELREVPHIDATMSGPKDAPPLYANLARTKMATGIYGGPDGNVYLLGREPTQKNGNDWWLFRISPKGVLLGKALLPSKAKHLSIVVSPDTFYLIERGDLDPFGGQQINTMVRVPASLLERAPPQGVEVCPRRK